MHFAVSSEEWKQILCDAFLHRLPKLWFFVLLLFVSFCYLVFLHGRDDDRYQSGAIEIYIEIETLIEAAIEKLRIANL